MEPTLTIRMSARLRKDLRQISKQEQVPVSDIVRKSVTGYISVYKFRQLRGKVLPYAEAKGWLTDEDVFRALK